MAQKFEQTQQQVQTQQLATLQVALAGLVELPIADLAEKVKDEMVDNAALEESDPEGGNETPDENQESQDDAPVEGDDDWDTPGEVGDAMRDYLNDDEVPEYLKDRADSERERKEAPLTGGTSSFDDLVNQIGEHDLSEHEREIMVYLIGSLDNDGFLRKDLTTLEDELAIYSGIETNEAELTHLLKVLQSFEPRGIGARSLQECLALQLDDPELKSPYKAEAKEVIEKYFKEFATKRWDIIRQRMGIDEAEAERVQNLLVHLNPRPGSVLGSGEAVTAPTVVPDFYVTVGDDGVPEVSLNNGDVPDLRVSRAFRDSIKQYAGRKGLSREQQDAYVYARQKVESAQTFIGLLQRRKQTLLAVMNAIASFQADFFISDDDEALLRPLTLKEVAARAGVDISTVSRVTNSKYVQTDYGTYPLKYFFSSQFTTSEGDELSSRKVRAALQEIVDAEDKRSPMSDEALAAALTAKGQKVARRTVAKYRELLGIPPARLRKQH